MCYVSKRGGGGGGGGGGGEGGHDTQAMIRGKLVPFRRFEFLSEFN